MTPEQHPEHEMAVIVLMSMAMMAAEYMAEHGTPPELSPVAVDPAQVLADAMQALFILGVNPATIQHLVGRARIGAL